MKTILVNGLSREQRIAVLDGKELADIKLLSAEKESLVGNIYAGRIEKIVPGMDAAFVYFGQGKNGFIRNGAFSPDLISIAFTVLLFVVSYMYKKYKKKPLSPIMLIVISAVMGISAYGV